MTYNISEEEKILRRIPFEILILASVIALASIFLFHLTTALFILAGGAFSALSFIWLKQSISRLLLLNGKKKGDRHLKEEELIEGFTKKYNIDKLVYYEVFDDIDNAIAREKQIKAGSRQKKIDIITSINPAWKDLSIEL